MENRCREGSLDKNNLPQSLNDNTHTQLCHRAFQALFVCLCICECNRVIISVYVNLHTICATKSANSIYSSIHNVSCYSHLIHITDFLFRPSLHLRPFEALYVDHSVAFITTGLRFSAYQERCPRHLTCNFKRCCAF